MFAWCSLRFVQSKSIVLVLGLKKLGRADMVGFPVILQESSKGHVAWETSSVSPI